MARGASFPLRPPIGSNSLDRLRLALRKKVPTAGLGTHLHRRMGQSLEFREYRDYVFGDDIRAVDWSASARRGGRWDYVAKSFEAEEQRTLIVLVDCRPAMRLPVAVPKLGVAAWIAGCLISAAQSEGDRAIVAPVFADPSKGSAKIIEGRGVAKRMRAALGDVLDAPLTAADWGALPAANVAGIAAKLKPAAAVVLITDALFDDPGSEIAKLARRAQRSFRSFHVVEIDSWPHERAMLEVRPFRLQSLAGRVFPDSLAESTNAFKVEAEAALAERRRAARGRISGPGLVWPTQALRYPAQARFEVEAAESWFAEALPRAAFLDSLMSRVS